MTRKLLIWCLLSLLTVTVAPIYAQDEAQVCNDVPAPRLVLTEQAQVTPGDPNRVRDFPSPDGAMLESIPGEGEFTVINGPVCSAGFYWWFVDYNGQMGWTVEGNGDVYWLEPLGRSLNEIPAATSAPMTESAIAFSGVSFTLTGDVALDTAGEVLSVVLDDGEQPYWSVAPQHIEFSFENFASGPDPLSGNPVWAELKIFPAIEYELITGDSIESIRAAIETPGDDQLRKIVAPPLNAGLIFTTEPQVIEFNGGKGIRYLAHFAQNFNPMADQGIIYVFGGLTDDDRTFIRAAFALNSTLVPDWNFYLDEEAFDYDAFLVAYHGEYLPAAKFMYENAPVSTFTPNLDALDAMMASFSINRVEMTGGCNSLTPQLIVDQMARQALSSDSLRVRSEPGGEPTGDNVFPGETLLVISGPECVNDVNWWQIQSPAGWTGWVAEAADDFYYFNPVTITPSPTTTFTPSPTYTPGPTATYSPTRTPIVTDCILIPLAQTNLHALPDPDSPVNGRMERYNARTYYGWRYYEREGEGYRWWLLAPISNNLYGWWVREDFVREEGDCDSLPFLDPYQDI
jgi:hypothetical protein